MRRVPPELDRLMWEVAEMDDQRSIDEFGERYPHCRPELAKRLRLTRAMRETRPEKRPQALFRPTSRLKSSPRWAVAMAFTLMLAAAGLATIAVSRYVLSNQETPQEFDVPTRAPRTTGFGDEYEPGIAPTEVPGARSPLSSPQPAFPDPRTDVPSLDENSQPEALDRPVTIDAAPIALHDALRRIAASAGFKIEIAPGTPNPEIMLSYTQTPASDILDRLGRNFGFRVIEQGPDEVVVIPDSSQEPETSLSGSIGN